MTTNQQSFFTAIGAEQTQEWGVRTAGTFVPTYSVLGGVVAPTAVVSAGGSFPTAPSLSDAQVDASAVVPTELDTRAVVLGSAATPASSAFTVPNRPSDDVLVRSAPVVFPPVDAGYGGS